MSEYISRWEQSMRNQLTVLNILNEHKVDYSRKRYYHDYYERVTKPKRQRLREEKKFKSEIKED